MRKGNLFTFILHWWQYSVNTSCYENSRRRRRLMLWIKRMLTTDILHWNHWSKKGNKRRTCRNGSKCIRRRCRPIATCFASKWKSRYLLFTHILQKLLQALRVINSMTFSDNNWAESLCQVFRVDQWMITADSWGTVCVHYWLQKWIYNRHDETKQRDEMMSNTSRKIAIDHSQAVALYRSLLERT